MKKRFFCLILSFYLIFSNLFITYDTAYATGLDAVAGWEAAVAGAGATLLLPFGQVAFLLFSLFGVTIAVNNGETIKEAGQDMWDDFTEWYENTFVPGLDVAHEKKEQMMQELANWEEKAENGIFSKVSQVWEALGEFADYVKENVKKKNETFDTTVPSSSYELDTAGRIIVNDKFSPLEISNDFYGTTDAYWNGDYRYKSQSPLKVTLKNNASDVFCAFYSFCVYLNAKYYLFRIFYSAKPFTMHLKGGVDCTNWRDFNSSKHCNRAGLSFDYIINAAEIYKDTRYLTDVQKAIPCSFNVPLLGSMMRDESRYSNEYDVFNSAQTLDITPGFTTDTDFGYSVLFPLISKEFLKNGEKEKDNEKETTLPGVLGKDWNTVAGQDKANVNESDEAIVLTGEGIRSKEKSKEKEQEAETEMEGVLGKVSDTSKSKENTAEQAKAVEEAYQKTGVKGVSNEEEVAKEISKSVNLPASENLEYQLKGLEKVFPFCIPFDIYDFINCLSAPPKAPKFTYKFYTKKDGKKGYDNIEIDLSAFDDLAEFLRLCELLLFIVGLAFVTRSHYVK